ncbi:hypothetical protein N0X72_15280 [Streptomyces carpaticus]|uniref:DUF2269 family protein n=1 Tax=Streptomyces cheonanensis TaxID=312720 RepID=A0ABP5GPB6_9ACTN|nr:MULTISPECIES: hypothetical protein [Streptomyces]UWM50265.1 hypothetical protein N0X72_15280 [Streptomyces carpaticus]
MNKFLLSVHVLAAIIAIGPVTVAASMFPPYVRKAVAEPGDQKATAALALLHRICRGYAAVGIVVPVFGVATAIGLGVLTDAWLIASMILTAAAAAVLLGRILPVQEALLAPEGDTAVRQSRHLGMTVGVFNLLWAVVVVLMIVRPGSTTGV